MKINLIVDEEVRMKFINYLKIYGYYKGILCNNVLEKKYISGELNISDIINNKKDFRELKLSIDKCLEYFYDNGFSKLEDIMNYFYKKECSDIVKKYGNFFDKL